MTVRAMGSVWAATHFTSETACGSRALAILSEEFNTKNSPSLRNETVLTLTANGLTMESNRQFSEQRFDDVDRLINSIAISGNSACSRID